MLQNDIHQTSQKQIQSIHLLTLYIYSFTLLYRSVVINSIPSSPTHILLIQSRQIPKPPYSQTKRLIRKTMLTRVSYMFSAIHTKICILGGGSGGLNISSHLMRTYGGQNIRIFDPATVHYYQPGFTMIGGDLCTEEVVVRPMKDIIPRDVTLTSDQVIKIEPERNTLKTRSGQDYTYDHLIVSVGVRLNWDAIKGAKEALDDPNCPVASIYSYEYAEKMRKLGRNFTGGEAIFTEPEPPIKCGGAPQKILYLWTSRWRDAGLTFKSYFNKVPPTHFGVPKYSKALEKIAAEYDIQSNYQTKLIEIKKDERTAVFLDLQTNQTKTQRFDLLHIVPPMVAPKFLADSGVTNAAGFIEINKDNLRHAKYNNIWAAGDCTSLPCSKTAAALFSQTEVLIKNLKSVLNGETPTAKYDGYSSCPIFTGNGKLMLAEFKYDGVLAESFFKDQEKPRMSFFYMKKDMFPRVYWHLVPRGVWGGKAGLQTW